VTRSNKYDEGGLVKGYEKSRLQNILIGLPNQSVSLKILTITVYLLVSRYIPNEFLY
jgi:hypothetical protein